MRKTIHTTFADCRLTAEIDTDHPETATVRPDIFQIDGEKTPYGAIFTVTLDPDDEDGPFIDIAISKDGKVSVA